MINMDLYSFHVRTVLLPVHKEGTRITASREMEELVQPAEASMKSVRLAEA